MKLFSILAAVLVAVGTLSLTQETSAKGGGAKSSGHAKTAGTKTGGTKTGTKTGGKTTGTKTGGTTGTKTGTKTGGTTKTTGGKGTKTGKGSGHPGNHGNGKHRDFRNWSRYCWFSGYSCYGYFCPSDSTWYYWYGPDGVYLPISEMVNFAPDNSTPPMLPPGATEIR